MAGRKHSSDEVEDRINEVIRQIIQGNTSSRGLQSFIIKNYQLSKAQALKDIAKAKQELREAVDENEKADYLAEAISRYNALTQINFDMRDFREVRCVLESKIKLLGLDRPSANSAEETSAGECKIEVEIKVSTVKLEIFGDASLATSEAEMLKKAEKILQLLLRSGKK